VSAIGEGIKLNDDKSKLQVQPTAGGRKLEPDNPIYKLASEIYERLRADLSPEEVLVRGVDTALDFIKTFEIADDKLRAWGWVLEPIFDLPVGWTTPGADPEGAALARELFENELGPAVVTVPEAATFLALPVIGHSEKGGDVAGAMIAIPIRADVELDDNLLAGAVAGAGIVGVQMENATGARAAKRALQFAQAASNTQRALIQPVDVEPALEIAIQHLAACDVLLGGVAELALEEGTREVGRFGDASASSIEDHASLSRSDYAAHKDATHIELEVKVAGEVEGTISLTSRYALGSTERDTLASIATAVAGTTVRFRAENTIDSLRRSATRRLVEAQERERSMIAADIHDGVLQQLGATAIRLELAQSRVDQSDFATASAIIADGTRDIRSCARELRSLLMELRPQVLDDNGLNAALVELGRHVSGTKVEVDTDVPEDLGNEFAITIFRIVQEALTNIEKHANAENASVRVALKGRRIRIEIVDDGVGYEGADTGPSSEGSHLGLLGMRERARMFGGNLMIHGTSGGGTVLHADLPLDGMQPEDF
jgi:signal transduction histidine kinase